MLRGGQRSKTLGSISLRRPAKVSCQKTGLSITGADSTVDSWREALLPFASSHWASHPSVSVFALSWQQRYDRSWVGVRDELWGNGQDFTRRTGGEHAHETTQRQLIESREGFDTDEGVFISPSLSSRARFYCLV